MGEKDVFVRVCVCVSVWVYVFLCPCVCTHLSVCVCVCVFRCLWVGKAEHLRKGLRVQERNRERTPKHTHIVYGIFVVCVLGQGASVLVKCQESDTQHYI